MHLKGLNNMLIYNYLIVVYSDIMIYLVESDIISKRDGINRDIQ